MGGMGTRARGVSGRRDCRWMISRGFTLARSVDPFTKKDWYDIKAPSMFSVRNIGKTLVSRTQGTKVRDWAWMR